MWIGIKLRPDHAREDLLQKLTALNMVNGFCRALMHKLRFQPYADYEDLSGYIGYLDTWARDAGKGIPTVLPKPRLIKRAGTHLGFPPFKENPRSLIKHAQKPLGNLPLEILMYLFSYIDNVIENKQVAVMGYVMQLGKLIASKKCSANTFQ
jgi:putative membrane protein